MCAHIDRELLQKNPMGPVRVTMPARVAYDIGEFKNSLTQVLENLGCPKCFSGADCTFQLEREYIVNPSGRVSASSVPTQMDSLGRDVHVSVSDPKATFELEGVFNILDRILGELGCMACCSGFDITFQTELDRFNVPRGINF